MLELISRHDDPSSQRYLERDCAGTEKQRADFAERDLAAAEQRNAFPQQELDKTRQREADLAAHITALERERDETGEDAERT